MKLNLKKMLATILATISVFGMVACAPSTSQSAETTPPDYSASTKQLTTYGYTPPPSNRVVDGDTYNFATEKRYKEYLEAGLNVLLLQVDDHYNGNEPWEDSALKKKMDAAQRAGIERVIMVDYRLFNLHNTSALYPSSQFEDEAELDTYVANCMKDYINHPVFYGLQLRDEPSYQYFDCMGQLYKAIKKYGNSQNKDVFIQINLLPMDQGNDNRGRYCKEVADTLDEAYKLYLTDFLDSTGADYIMFDSYPMRPKGIQAEHYRTLKTITDLAKERGVDVYAVAQTCSFKPKGANEWTVRICDEEDLYFQLNLYMGMGIKQISYFNYWKKANSDSEDFADEASFITNDGNKTEIYSIMQNMHKEMQSLAKVLMNFDYKNAYCIRGEINDHKTSHLGAFGKNQLSAMTQLKEVKIKEHQSIFITELYDEEKDYYMYMIQNALDPKDVLNAEDYSYDYDINGLNAELTFDKGNLLVIDKGVQATEKLENNTYSISLAAGQAVFVIPY